MYIYIYTSVELCISMHRVLWKGSCGDLEVVLIVYIVCHVCFVLYLGPQRCPFLVAVVESAAVPLASTLLDDWGPEHVPCSSQLSRQKHWLQTCV